MRLKNLYFLYFFILLQQLSFGQQLNGVVKDGDNLSLEGATIQNMSNKEITYTDRAGTFGLTNVRLNDTLQVSFIGFETGVISVRSLDEDLAIILQPSIISLSEIVIAPKIDALNLLTLIDVNTKPVNSSQEILQKVPGLFIGQHAGGGKAEQIFLRGFDIDHGTDINITVDGLPVNMVSHAHGQGYADLHFLIPETIQKIDFGKGPYYADQGNFTTAGYVDFKTKDQLEDSFVKLEGGQFNTRRLVSGISLSKKPTQNSFIAAEFLASDGPFESSQDFTRTNLFGKYLRQLNTSNQLKITASYFTSTWTASGQIPQRAVDSGLITRFGAIDDTEGGTTSRFNVLLNHRKSFGDNTYLESKAFYTYYDFELFSNFTFFLNDAENGDQIRQREQRSIYGLQSELNHRFYTNKLDGKIAIGLSLRSDHTNGSELSRTANRSEVLAFVQLGDVDETNLGTYVNTTLDMGKWTINPALRLDFFRFQYLDELAINPQAQSENAAIFSPKLNILYNQNNQIQWYLKTGKGFHANDSRVVVANNGRETLPNAYGTDLGFIWKPTPKIILNTAYWYLFLEQEFVYVGDEGIVEPSGKTTRQGVDFSLRWQLLKGLFWNLDANYTLARSSEEPDGADFIPLAPERTFVTGLNLVPPSNINAGINVRYLHDRPANEDNSIVATGYTVVDFNAGYRWRNLHFGLQVQNLFDTDWNETQFATESRLRDELNSVEEIHFTPGTPFFLKGTVSYLF